MSVDDQLLDNSNRTADRSQRLGQNQPDRNFGPDARAGDLRAARRSRPEPAAPAEASSLRQAVQLAKREEAKKEGEKGGALADKIGSVFKDELDATKRSMWESIISSYGATLIIINILVLGRAVFGKRFFSKLGGEWLKAGPLKKVSLPGQSDDPGCLGEVIVLVALDALVLLLILGILMIIGLILEVVGDPIKLASALADFLWHWVSGGGVTTK